MMTKLDQAIASARSVPEENPDMLADAIAALSATYGAPAISAEHQAEIARRFAEPFVEADPAEVDALFARHGA